MRIAKYLAVPLVSALVITATAAEARDRHYRHRHQHHHNGAAVGAAIGAGIVLGALAASSARANDEIYIEDSPPPYPADGYRDRGEEASHAVEACRIGLLNAARKYGAFDAEVGDIYSVREAGYGYRVEAEVTIEYPDYSRTSGVTCHTEDGFLVSARTD